MIKEYALDPSLLNSWERVRSYCEQFGFEKGGRMISRFPKTWKRLVWDNVSSAPDRERKRIEEYLRRAEDRMMPRLVSRKYDGERSWHENAAADHQREPFTAIITDHPMAGVDAVICNEDFSEEHRLLKGPRHVEVPRTPRDIAKALAPVLETATMLLLIDPHFAPQPSEHATAPVHRGTKWTLPLAAMLLRIPAKCRVEYHAVRPTNRGSRIPLGDDDSRERASWEASCLEGLPHVLPANSQLTVARWQECQGGEEFHARYILTDRFALQVDPGLDADRNTASHLTKFTYLGEIDRVTLVAKFAETASVYTLLSRHDIVGVGDCLAAHTLESLR